MAATAMIVELLVIGLSTSIWLLMIIMRVARWDASVLRSFVLTQRDLLPQLTVVVMLAIYQIGWLMNSLAAGIVWLTLRPTTRDPIFRQRGLTWGVVRAAFYQRASQQSKEDVKVDLGVIRLARAGSLNFLLIGIVALLYGRSAAAWSILPFILSAGSAAQLWFRYRRYYRAVLAGYLDMQPAPVGIAKTD